MNGSPTPSTWGLTWGVAWRFALVSAASFSCWAFGGAWLRSEAALYTACAAVFLALGSLAVHPAVRERISLGRFLFVFIAAFLAYAACWCGFWFWLHDKKAEIFGSLTGTVAMAAVFQCLLGRPSSLLTGSALLFFWHTAGYFGGEWFSEWLGGVTSTPAKLGWGIGYGLGFGAGMGA